MLCKTHYPGVGGIEEGSESAETPERKPAPADTFPLAGCVTISYCLRMGHYYRFKRGDAVTITSGRYKGAKGIVDSAVFQRTVDWPDEYAPGYHVVLDTGPGGYGAVGPGAAVQSRVRWAFRVIAPLRL